MDGGGAAAATQRVGLGQTLYAALVVWLASVPLLRGREFVLRDGTVLMPDLKETLLSTMAAQHLAQGTGAWSRLGLYHPGPLWFYSAAGPLWLADQHPSGLVLAAACIVSASLVLVAIALYRCLGLTHAMVGLLAVAMAFSRLGLRGLVYPWNPTVIILPTTAAIACTAWCLARRSYAAPVLMVFLASFLSQAHLGALALGAVLLLAALVGAWINGSGRARIVTGVAVGVALLVCWAPVIHDQAVGTGNAGAVAKYALTGDVSQRFAPEAPSTALDLSVPSAAAHLIEVTALASGETAAWGGAEFTVGLEHDVRPSSLVVFAVLLLLCLVGTQPRRLRPRGADAFTAWMARLILLCLALELLAAMRARTEFRYYLVATSAGVGAAMWVCSALVLVRVMSRLPLPVPRAVLRIAVSAAVAIGIVTIMVFQLRGNAGRFDFEDDAHDPVIARIIEASDGQVIGIETTSPFNLDQAQWLAVTLERRGHRVAVGPELAQRFSDQQRNRRAELTVVVSPPDAAPAGCASVGTFRGAGLCLRPPA